MGGKNTLAAATLTAALTASSPAITENSDTLTKNEITCETKLACQKLTDSIQAQIDELEIKGLENLSDDEFENYALLSDDLIIAEKLETAHNEKLITSENQKQEKQQITITVENQKQEKQQKTIASENLKQKENSDLIDAKLKAQDAQIAGLRGALLEN